MKKLLGVLLVAALALNLAACGNAGGSSAAAPAESGGNTASAQSTAPADPAKTMTLRFATDSSEEYVSTVEIYKFANAVKEKTNGRITIEVYAGAQLGDEKACVEQIQMGSLDFTKSSMGALTSFNEKLTVLSMPYLFRSADHLWAAMDSEVGQQLLESMSAVNIVGLGWLDAGSRCFYATKPLNTIADFSGKKIRVMESSIYTDMVKCLGGSAIAMAGSDVYSALQTGVVDAAENNVPRIIDMSHNEQCPYLILDRHNIMPEMVIMSQSTWGKLDAADQTIIKECAQDLQKSMISAWEATENAALQALRDGGMTIVEPDAATLQSFRDAMQPVYDQYGAPYAEIISKIEAIGT